MVGKKYLLTASEEVQPRDLKIDMISHDRGRLQTSRSWSASLRMASQGVGYVNAVCVSSVLTGQHASRLKLSVLSKKSTSTVRLLPTESETAQTLPETGEVRGRKAIRSGSKIVVSGWEMSECSKMLTPPMLGMWAQASQAEVPTECKRTVHMYCKCMHTC